MKKEQQAEKEYEAWLDKGKSGSKADATAKDEEGGDAGEGSVPETLVPQIQPRGGPPCELPVWCVVPNEDDIVRSVGIFRENSTKSGSTIGRRKLLLGRRPWVLLGRRDKPASGSA